MDSAPADLCLFGVCEGSMNMLSDANYMKILSYFDRQFWSGKTDETNWNYYGMVLDWYFDNSVFCVDYLDVADYFDNNGGFQFSETAYFSEQYAEVSGLKRLQLIQAVLIERYIGEILVYSNKKLHILEMRR